MPVFVRLGNISALKRELKMHTLLEYDRKLPVYVNITKGSVTDIKERKTFPWKRLQSLLQTGL